MIRGYSIDGPVKEPGTQCLNIGGCRSGGFIFPDVPRRSTSSSVKIKCWGVTSAVTRTPDTFAARTKSAANDVDICNT